MNGATLLVFWIAVGLLAVSLVADGVYLVSATWKRRRFRNRWTMPATSGGSLSARLAPVQPIHEQPVRDIVAARPILRADQRRAR